MNIKQFLIPNKKIKKIIFFCLTALIVIYWFRLPWIYPEIFSPEIFKLSNAVIWIIHILVFIIIIPFPFIILAYKEEKVIDEEKYKIPGHLIFLPILKILSSFLFLFLVSFLMYHFLVHFLKINRDLASYFTIFIFIPALAFFFFKKIVKHIIQDTERSDFHTGKDNLHVVVQRISDWAFFPTVKWIIKNIKCPKCKNSLSDARFFWQNQSFLAFQVRCKKCGKKNLKTGVFNKTLRFID